ncbi:carboxylate-amine ligase [Kitasatospora azatica]|uniref:carboxylate-amine ligase n=1 Tax=Kitasatospora azatica TaxID=58347 RepID=UPI0005626BC2|nr:glutamate--cysteine ligase [Kitasatospora azatica]
MDEPLRFGAEEEYLLVDPVTGTTAPRAPQVLADAARELGERAQAEFYRTQVEACTRPVWTAEALREELLTVRTALAAAATRAGCRLVATGTAVLPSRHPLPVTDHPRYHRIAQLLGAAVADQLGGEVCGCHIHVGDLTRAEAIAVSNRLRPWLPVLQAIATNSPFFEGQDVGLASCRAARYSRWPLVGPPPLLDAAGYERAAEQLVASGRVVDRRGIYWYARPSEHLPTLEVRIADVNADLDVTVLLAVLIRALARVLLGEARAGLPAPPVRPPALREAHRRAARSGLAATGVDPLTGTELPMPRLLCALLDRAAPGLAAAGDLDLARTLTAPLLSGRTGAQTQRAVLARTGSLHRVVDQLARLTAGIERPALAG